MDVDSEETCSNCDNYESKSIIDESMDQIVETNDDSQITAINPLEINESTDQFDETNDDSQKTVINPLEIDEHNNQSDEHTNQIDENNDNSSSEDENSSDDDYNPDENQNGDEIFDNLVKNCNLKSNRRYNITWNNFIDWLGKSTKPTEHDFIKYFNQLSMIEKKAPTTITCYFSIINHHYQLKYNKSIYQWKRLRYLLKGVWNTKRRRRKSGTFSRKEIFKFLTLKETENRYYLVRKAFAIISLFGGLRSIEAKKLTFKDVTINETEKSINVKFERAKQWGKEFKTTTFSIFRQIGHPIFYNTIVDYIKTVESDLGTETITSDDLPFFLNPKGKNSRKFNTLGFGMGMIQALPKQICKNLNITRYVTSHCWRRSSANIVANSGATTMQMMNFFSWTSEATALMYLNEALPTRLTMNRKIAGNNTSNNSSNNPLNNRTNPNNIDEIINMDTNDYNNELDNIQDNELLSQAVDEYENIIPERNNSNELIENNDNTDEILSQALDNFENQRITSNFDVTAPDITEEDIEINEENLIKKSGLEGKLSFNTCTINFNNCNFK